ncbi:MAG: hypothetical protein J6A38_01300 [Clostridia bacterium]|nr:hypothetical protein [Clostridia bacterium]
MIKPQFETYRYVGEVCRLQGQSAVECRLPGSEISNILAVQAHAISGECTCSDGEVQYGGKVLLCIVYEDGERKICRAERGVEFFHKADGKAVTPACFAKNALSAENISWRREGSGLYISAIVDAELTVYGGKQIEYLSGGDGLIAKTDTVAVCKTVCVSGETEGEDDFETDYVGDILLHSEKAVVHRVQAGGGQVDIEGELGLNICALKSDDSLCSYERLIPFKMQIPSEEAFGTITSSARVEVKSATLTAGVDEEKGRSKITLSYCLSADCYLCAQEEISVVSDAFSPSVALTLKRTEDGGRCLTKHGKCTERVSGVALINPVIDGEYTLQSATLPRAEIVCRKGENGLEAEGLLQAEILLVGADGGHRSTTLSLPFVFPLGEVGDDAEGECMVCGLNVRRKKEGETEAEATVKCSFRVFEKRTWGYVSALEEGETCDEPDCAFSVFIARAGEDLWQISKRLNCPPDELQKHNPNLEFPLKESEKIYVYRQIR